MSLLFALCLVYVTDSFVKRLGTSVSINSSSQLIHTSISVTFHWHIWSQSTIKCKRYITFYRPLSKTWKHPAAVGERWQLSVPSALLILVACRKWGFCGGLNSILRISNLAQEKYCFFVQPTDSRSHILFVLPPSSHNPSWDIHPAL